jgi:hypothetical protein
MQERSPKTLAEIQEECRRFAAEVSDQKASRILSQAADELERYAKETRPGNAPTLLN